MLLNLLVQTRQYFFENWKQIFAHENKQVPTKVAFLTAQVENSSIANQPKPAQNQPKSHILFNRNDSTRDFYIMALAKAVIQESLQTFQILPNI